jgi:hypothetical protein
LPRIKITDLLLEVDRWTGFSECFTHQLNGSPETGLLGRSSSIDFAKCVTGASAPSLSRLGPEPIDCRDHPMKYTMLAA